MLSVPSPDNKINEIIHLIRRFKSSDWFKRKSHDMDDFRHCSCSETNPCVLFLTISLTLEEAVTAAEF